MSEPESTGAYRLTLYSQYGKRRSGFAVITLIKGDIRIAPCDSRLRQPLERLLMNDFDEHIGFPAYRIRARQGTLAALDAVAEYFLRGLNIQSEMEVLE